MKLEIREPRSDTVQLDLDSMVKMSSLSLIDAESFLDFSVKPTILTASVRAPRTIPS